MSQDTLALVLALLVILILVVRSASSGVKAPGAVGTAAAPELCLRW